MPHGDEVAMAASTNITAVLRALESTIQNERQRRDSSFSLSAVLDEVVQAIFQNVTCTRRDDTEQDTGVSGIVSDSLAGISRKFSPPSSGKEPVAQGVQSHDPVSDSVESTLTTRMHLPSPWPLHGRLPDGLYLRILRLVGDGVSDVNLRNCRLADRFVQTLVDCESIFWTPVVLHGAASALHPGFFIDRAGPAPIDVSLRLTTDQHYAVDGPLAQVTARMRRIGSLTIVADRPILGPAFVDLLAVEAPFLLALVVDALIGGEVPTSLRIAEHPKLRRLRATVSCLRAFQSANMVALRHSITHLEVTAGGGKATLNEICGFFPGLQSVTVIASCLEDSFDRILNIPPELELVDDGDSEELQQSAGARACLLMRPLRRLIVRRASTKTIDLVRAHYEVVHRLAIMPTQIAFWVGFERARIFPDAHPDVIAGFIATMRVHTLSSLIISRLIPTAVLRRVSKGDFRRLRVLTVYVGPTPCDKRHEWEAADVFKCRRTWWCTRLRELRIVARTDHEAVASGNGLPTVKAADIIRFVQDTLRYAPLRELRFERVRLAEGMEGPQDRNVRKLVRRVHFE